MEPEEQKAAKYSEIQRIVTDYLGGIVSSSREFQAQTGISHSMFGRYKDMDSMMGVDKLEHIVSKFPELKLRVIEYLRGNTDEKLTREINTDNAALKRLDLKDELESAYHRISSENDDLIDANKKLTEDNRTLIGIIDRLTLGNPSSPYRTE